MSRRSDADVDVLAVGDVFLNRDDPASAFNAVRADFDRADLRVCNLEAGLAESGEEMLFRSAHIRSPPNALDGLEAAGFDLVSFANNHAMDFGPTALLETIDTLSGAGIDVAGAGRTRAAAEAVVTRRVEGVRVGLVAFEATQHTEKVAHQAHEDRAGMNMLAPSGLYPPPHVSEGDADKLRRVVRTAAADVDVLLVAMHFGIAPEQTPTTAQRELSRIAVDAGADAVLGAHPHVLQGVDVYRSAPIFYSLGHFVFDSTAEFGLELEPGSMFAPVSDATAVVRLGASTDGISTATVYPASVDGTGNPTLPTPGSAEYEDVAATLVELSAREGTTLERADDHLVVPL